MAADGWATGQRPTLAAKLDRLFRTVRPAGKAEYSFEDVASTIRETGGPTISATYIWQLRRGVRDNPTKRHLEALAGFFGVSPAYFIDDDASARVYADLDLLVALRDTQVRHVALGAAGLSRESLDTISEMIDRVRQLEGLAEPETHESTGQA